MADDFSKLTYEQIHEGIYSDLGKRARRLAFAGKPESEVAALIEAQPLHLRLHASQFSELAVIGMFSTYGKLLDTGCAYDAHTREQMHARGPVQPNTWVGSKPVSNESESLRLMVDSLSSAIAHLKRTEPGEEPAKIKLPPQKVTANVGHALDMIAQRADGVGADKARIFSPDIFIAHHNFSIVPKLRKISPEAFEENHRHSEWMVFTGSSRNAGELSFYDTYAFLRANGAKPDKLLLSSGWRAWPDDTAETRLYTTFNAAIRAGDCSAAQAALTGQTLRTTQCLYMGREAFWHLPEMMLPVFDCTQTFNKQGLASYMITEIISGGFQPKDSPHYSKARDEQSLRNLDGLLERGGDINAHQGKLLLLAANHGRMDVASALIARGADIAVARGHANNSFSCDNDQGVGWYDTYPDAKRRLRNYRPKPAQGKLDF